MSRPLAPLRGALKVGRRELRAYLVVPWTYAVAVAFLLLTGTLFFRIADGSKEASLRFWFPNLAFVLIVTAPIVTSRLVAEEWRSRHLDILLSRPLTPAGLVVGKWLAAVAFFVALLVPTLVYSVFLAAWGEPDWPPIVASYAGAVFLIGLFAAIGTMTSSLTPTAVAAGLGAFALIVTSQLSTEIGPLRGLSFQPHLDGFARGAPALDDFVYFASGTAAALVIAAAWQSLRRRTPGGLSWQRARVVAVPAATLAALLAVNLVPLPADARVDLTAAGRFTLSSASKEVLENVRRDARITVFAPAGSPEERDARVLLRQFERENGFIETRVLDFARYQGEALRLGARDDGDVVVEVGDRKEVSAPLVEQLITSSLQRLARGRPQTLCNLAGHGERELDSEAPDGYQLARAAVEANGIETMRLDLTVAREIPEQCTILSLIGPNAELLPDEVRLLGDYLADRGRMLIMREPGGPDLDAVTTPWGLRLLPGLVFDPERALAGDPTALLVNTFPTESPVSRDVDGALLVTAGGITTSASDDPGLTVSRVLQSSEGSWLETDPATPAYDPNAGDRGGPVVLGGAADRSEVRMTGETRVSGNQESIARTRLLVYTDADWATNAFIDRLANRRMLVNGLNWLAGEEDIVAVGGEDPDLRRLEITDDQRALMAWTSIAGVPGVALVAGVGVWLWRRKR